MLKIGARDKDLKTRVIGRLSGTGRLEWLVSKDITLENEILETICIKFKKKTPLPEPHIINHDSGQACMLTLIYSSFLSAPLHTDSFATS